MHTYLIVGSRYNVPSSNLGKIPFNCNFNYDLPEKIKIACKVRLISCTLGFSLYAFPFIPIPFFLLIGFKEKINIYQIIKYQIILLLKKIIIDMLILRLMK